MFTRRKEYPSTHIFPFFFRRVYKAARVTLAGGLTFSLVNTPGRVNSPTRVNVLIVSRPFESNQTLSVPGL